ncbi:hypothetical protein M378DRAFT_1057835 [Amanita muscaria Koide BX008]|uniref:Uncharacterized protein n=1 Tax=Amanita muscaria (strain Koide BX008) TaxID=946122 RepID=A0A0C2XH92_AMAMK|nr:hypothetical protein M378DRAFT_1057835 [Amanita muscaria Koide BX008]
MSTSELVLKLAALLEQSLESVEVLPGSVEEWSAQGARLDYPFILVEGHLGIPKKVLYMLYIAAIAMFHRSESEKHIAASTSVVLLANSAHQTALNTRKRLILRRVLSMEREIAFTRLLLCGSSECAKQSIIWDHRRWIFGHLYGTTARVLSDRLQILQGWLDPLEGEKLPSIPADVARKELSLVRHACGIYPRNYHGWNHWRYIMNVVYVYLDQGKEWKELADEEFSVMMKWVDSHVSDYTAMHHLVGFVERFGLDRTALINQVSDLKAHYASHEALEKYSRLLGEGVDKITNT